MEIQLSAHEAYHHQYHLAWIPKYRRRVPKEPLKDFLTKKLGEIRKQHPEVEIQRARRENHFLACVLSCSKEDVDVESDEGSGSLLVFPAIPFEARY